MDPQAAKYVSAALMLVTTFISGVIPNRLIKWIRKSGEKKDVIAFEKQKKRTDLILASLLAFGGGVLLGTAFLHLLPEVHDMVDGAVDNGFPDIAFPIVETVTCVGLFLVSFVEEIAQLLLKKYAKAKRKRKESKRINAVQVISEGDSRGSEGKFMYMKEVNGVANPTKDCLVPEDSPSRLNGIDNPNFIVETKLEVASGKTEEVSNHEHGHSHSLAMNDLSGDSVSSSIRSILVIIALSAHCVLEGMIIGLEVTAIDVFFLMLAISIHKLVIIFCLGLEMALSNIKLTLHCLYVFVFAVMSPIGILVGALVTNALDLENPYQAVTLALLQALGAGTLLYVVFFEVLEKDRYQNTNPFLKLLMIILGFSVIAGMEFIDH